MKLIYFYIDTDDAGKRVGGEIKKIIGHLFTRHLIFDLFSK
jgi:hypothetical protein